MSEFFTYTSSSVYLVLSSVRATNLCGTVGTESTQIVTLSFPPNYLYTYVGEVGILGIPGNQVSPEFFNPTDSANCTTSTVFTNFGAHFADPYSLFIVAPTQLLDLDLAFSTCKAPGSTPGIVGSKTQPQQLPPAVDSSDSGSNDQSQPAVPGAVSIPIPEPSFSTGQGQHKPSVISLLSQAFTANSDSVFVAPSATLIPRGPPITILNTLVSLAPSANSVLVGLNTYVEGTAPTSAVAVLPLGDKSITANTASQFIIGSQILNPGGVVMVWVPPLTAFWILIRPSGLIHSLINHFAPNSQFTCRIGVCGPNLQGKPNRRGFRRW